MKSSESAMPARPAPRVIPFRRAQRKRSEELAFLPAALEIVETPPSPIGRAIAAAIALVFCAALLWAWWGTIDIVASATGKILPGDGTKVVQPFETGVVRSIRVQDGQAVKAGDVLIELDPTVNAAERDHLRNDLLAERLNIARLRAALAGGDDPAGRFHAARRCRPGTGHHSASAVAEPGDRAPRQDCRTAAPTGAEGSRASHNRGDNPQARDDHSGDPVARRHPQDAGREGTGFEAHLFRGAPAACRATGGVQAFRRAICTRPKRRSPRSARPAARRRRNTGIRSPTNWPRPSRRRTGWPRT